jgi:hypothetical protein
MWVGVYWHWPRSWRASLAYLDVLHVYVCLLPCLPLHVTVLERWPADA